MGGNVGLLISSFILYVFNEKRRRDELKKEKSEKKDYL
jgi:hypothetical protein